MRIVASPVYLDASALAKVYVPEAWSEELERALLGRRDLLASDLAVTELTSALARRVRDGELARSHARRVYQRVQRDLTGGEFRQVELTGPVHREAERLLMGLGRRVALRAADALHLALAALVGARVLVTFDRRMDAAARALGTFELPAQVPGA
ncbi:MAG: type II toxin-antitoxin system VapC family toxin [Candidatus Rokubacteria bacterium]|nr:type II toxin-antitoxin system VapC family toxin [Candidatus Rokubacteria bacterium]